MAVVMYAEADLSLCAASREFFTEMMGKSGKAEKSTVRIAVTLNVSLFS